MTWLVVYAVGVLVVAVGAAAMRAGVEGDDLKAKFKRDDYAIRGAFAAFFWPVMTVAVPVVVAGWLLLNGIDLLGQRIYKTILTKPKVTILKDDAPVLPTRTFRDVADPIAPLVVRGKTRSGAAVFGTGPR